ncbi:hypothetical protein ID850_15040 [Xenorhabdus sp. Flor]|nr:hypothetical protein [Xenorhabdus sp. Flor]
MTSDKIISEVGCTKRDYARYSCAPKRGVGTTSDTPQITERGVITLPDKAWQEARRRNAIIEPLLKLNTVGHQASDTAAQTLGLSRRQVYALISQAGFFQSGFLSYGKRAACEVSCINVILRCASPLTCAGALMP